MTMLHPTNTGGSTPRPLTGLAFATWVGQAMPGNRLMYHSGLLGRDAAICSEPERRRLQELARTARRAFEAGLVHLVQQRLGPGRFGYLAIARTRRRREAPSPTRRRPADKERTS